MNNVFSTAALLASSVLLQTSSLVAASTPCDYTLEDSVATGIRNDVDLLLSVSDESLPTFDDQLRLMNFAGSPGGLNDLTPPHQRVKFNSYLHSAHGNNYFTGYEGGEFLGYYPDDLLFRWRPAGAYDANIDQRTAYTFDPINGDAKDVVSTDAYDPRVRGWYQDAMGKCSSDLLGTYTCGLHWTAPYVFASDGNLGITPALAFLDHASGSPLGVTAYGFKLSNINTLLSDAVQGKPNMIAYIMEGDGYLIAVSDGSPVSANGVRLNAKDSSDASIASSATLVVDDHYRSDQTVLIGTELITIKRYEKDEQLQWYIVVLEPYDPNVTGGDDDCIIAIETDMLVLTSGEVDLYLTNLIEAGELTADALRLGLIPSYTPPTAVDEAYGIQDYIWATVRNCDVTRMIYVGYEDGTFVGYNHPEGWSTFRGGDGLADSTRYYYHNDESSGEALAGAYKSKEYDPRVRPWYTHAEAVGKGSFSPIFVFSTSNTLGITYSVPFYDNGVFKGVVGVDISLVALDDLLAKQAEPGFGVFIFENERTSADDAYDMVASSSNVVVANSTRQHKAYDVEHVESYYVATVSQHLYDNSLVHDLDLLDLSDVTAEVMNYDARTLNWRIVAYATEMTTTIDGGTSASEGEEEDDDMKAVLGLAAASFAVLVVILGLVVVGLVLVKKGVAAKPPMSGEENSSKL